MDRAGKPTNQANVGIESTTEPEKEQPSGITKTGKNVKTVFEENKTPKVESQSLTTSLYQRTGQTSEPAENLLKNTDIADSLATSDTMNSFSDNLEATDHNNFESLLILADMDPLLGMGEASAASVKEEIANLNDYVLENSASESEHAAVKSNLLSEKTSRLLKHSYLDNFTRCLIKQMKNKNISLEDVSKDVFKKELNILLKDMHSRGIGLSSKIRVIGSNDTEQREKSKHKFYASPTSYSSVIEDQNHFRMSTYNRYFSKLPEFDAKLEVFLNSDKCIKWDSNQPIYRGGDVSNERKTLRNIEKNKKPFRKDLINRGDVLQGFGQYYTSTKRVAGCFASGTRITSPVVLTTFIKPGTPIIKDQELINFFKETPPSSYKEDILTWREYLNNCCKKPIMVCKTTSPQGRALTITLPHGDVIDYVNMVAVGDFSNSEKFKAVADLSIHRLGEDCLIQGHPEKFEKVEVSNTTQLESTDFVALGYTSGEPLPVKKCQLDEKVLYFVEAPDNKDDFLLVKQLPESLKDDIPTFILEPSRDFLLQRKKKKLDELKLEENVMSLEKKAEENIGVVRSYFNILGEQNTSS